MIVRIAGPSIGTRVSGVMKKVMTASHLKKEAVGLLGRLASQMPNNSQKRRTMRMAAPNGLRRNGPRYNWARPIAIHIPARAGV